MISGGVKFFDKSVTLLTEGASVTVSSGQASAKAMLDTNAFTRWSSSNSDDATLETIEVYFLDAKAIDRLAFLTINWKQFEAEWFDGTDWNSFTGVEGLDGPLTGIDESDFEHKSAYYEFDEVTAFAIRVHIQTTQTPDLDKHCVQVIATKEIGTLKGFPGVRNLGWDRNERITQMLSGKASIARVSETMRVELDFSNYPNKPQFYPDLELMRSFFQRDRDLIIWLCGGRFSSPFFSYQIKGFRLEDMIQVQLIGGHDPGYYKNLYKGPINLRAKFVETVSGVDQEGDDMLVSSIVVTANYTASRDDDVILVDASAGEVTIMLPSASVLGRGKQYRIKKIDTSINHVRIEPVAGTIDDKAFLLLRRQNDASVVVTSATDYFRFSWVVRDTDYWDFEENDTPGNPDPSYHRIFVKTDGTVWKRDSDGNEFKIGEDLSSLDDRIDDVEDRLDILEPKVQVVEDRLDGFGFLQYINSATQTNNTITFASVLLGTNFGSVPNGFFTKLSATEFRADYSGLMRLSYSLSIQEAGNNRGAEVRLTINGIPLPGSLRRNIGSSANAHGTVSLSGVLPVNTGDIIVLQFRSTVNGQVSTINIGFASMTIERYWP